MNKNINNKSFYGDRVLADKVRISNNTRVTGLNNNDLIIGSSGCGKTGGYVIPNIQNINGSLVVSDTKGQLERRFKDELISKGYDVYCIDLVNMQRSCGYNPMDYIGRMEDGSYSEKDILSLANLLTPDLCNDDPFWCCSASSYIAFLICYCLEAEPEKQHNLVRIGELHRRFAQPNGDLPFLNWIEDHKNSFAAKKYYEFSFVRCAEKTYSSILAFVNQYLEAYTFKEAKYLFDNDNKFDIGDLGKKKTVLFLNVSDTDRTYDCIANIFYSQALKVLCADADASPDGQLTVPVRIIMDDFAASGKIPNFDKIISVIRSRDISVSLIIQSLSQIESMYNKSISNTIINNCDHIIYMGSQDVDTASFVGSRAQKTPETILTMPRNKVCLLESGKKASFVDKIVPYSTLENQRVIELSDIQSDDENVKRQLY